MTNNFFVRCFVQVLLLYIIECYLNLVRSKSYFNKITIFYFVFYFVTKNLANYYFFSVTSATCLISLAFLINYVTIEFYNNNIHYNNYANVISEM